MMKLYYLNLWVLILTGIAIASGPVAPKKSVWQTAIEQHNKTVRQDLTSIEVSLGSFHYALRNEGKNCSEILDDFSRTQNSIMEKTILAATCFKKKGVSDLSIQAEVQNLLKQKTIPIKETDIINYLKNRRFFLAYDYAKENTRADIMRPIKAAATAPALAPEAVVSDHSGGPSSAEGRPKMASILAAAGGLTLKKVSAGNGNSGGPAPSASSAPAPMAALLNPAGIKLPKGDEDEEAESLDDDHVSGMRPGTGPRPQPKPVPTTPSSSGSGGSAAPSTPSAASPPAGRPAIAFSPGDLLKKGGALRKPQGSAGSTSGGSAAPSTPSAAGKPSTGTIPSGTGKPAAPPPVPTMAQQALAVQLRPTGGAGKPSAATGGGASASASDSAAAPSLAGPKPGRGASSMKLVVSDEDLDRKIQACNLPASNIHRRPLEQRVREIVEEKGSLDTMISDYKEVLRSQIQSRESDTRINDTAMLIKVAMEMNKK